MAAVSSPPLVHYDESLSMFALHGFLHQAAALYGVALAMHRDENLASSKHVDALQDGHLETLFAKVKDSVLLLQAARSPDLAWNESSSTPLLAALVEACSKVGQDPVCSLDLLLRSYVLRLKRPPEEIEHHRRLDEWWPDIALAMTHARYIIHDQDDLQRKFLNELNCTLSWYWLHKPQDPYDHWARNAFGTYEVRMKAPPIWQPFLCLATKFGLTEYVQEEIQARNADDENCTSRELERPDATPLLSYATEFLCSRNKTIFPVSDPRLVEFLLRNECRINPGVNHEYIDFVNRVPMTSWIALLRHLRDARRRGWIEFYDIDSQGVERWAEIVRLFLEVGRADVKGVVVADRWDPEITALGVLELLDDTYGSAMVKKLRDLIERVQD